MHATTSTLMQDTERLLPELVALRRAIHAEPELGLQTPKTCSRLRAALAGLPLEFREGPSTTGFVAVLRGASPGRSVLLRADTDALPMPEETGLEFASGTAGVMHACGHDAHSAMLVGAAKLLCTRRESLPGDVLFMFQPGEEGFHGARHMLEDGLLDPLPDAAFALHVMPNAPHGVFGGRTGPLLASADEVRIYVTGRGGHASMPHDALDPVPVACEIVSAIQTLVTRNIPVHDPVVVTISKIEAGTTHNVIPDSAFLLGTMRTLSEGNRQRLQENLARLARGIAAAHGASAEVIFKPGFPVTVCDGRAVEVGRSAVQGLFGREAWEPQAAPRMGAEDFAYVLEKVPGAMFFLGAAPADGDWRGRPGLHSTRMMLDEAVMARGSALHAEFAMRVLRDGLPPA